MIIVKIIKIIPIILTAMNEYIHPSFIAYVLNLDKLCASEVTFISRKETNTTLTTTQMN